MPHHTPLQMFMIQIPMIYQYRTLQKIRKVQNAFMATVCYQKEGMSLLEYQALPSLRDVAHDGVLCTFRNRSAPGRGKWCSPSGSAAWTVHHVQNQTLLGHSHPASQAGRRVGPALYSLRPHCPCYSQKVHNHNQENLPFFAFAVIGSTPPPSPS